MATHTVVLKVTVVMDEMDGTLEQSAAIALDLVEDALGAVFPHGADDADGKDDLLVEVVEGSVAPYSKNTDV